MRFRDASQVEIQAEIGLRLRRERLNQNLTRSLLAERAGVSEKTLQALESGSNVNLGTVIAVLRALGMVDRLDAMVPEPPPSPIQIAEMRGRQRQRASRRNS